MAASIWTLSDVTATCRYFLNYTSGFIPVETLSDARSCVKVNVVSAAVNIVRCTQRLSTTIGLYSVNRGAVWKTGQNGFDIRQEKHRAIGTRRVGCETMYCFRLSMHSIYYVGFLSILSFEVLGWVTYPLYYIHYYIYCSGDKLSIIGCEITKVFLNTIFW